MILDFHDAVYRQVVAGEVAQDTLAAMAGLYSHDATQTYTQLVGDQPTKDSLRTYFETRAEQLPEVLMDPRQRFWTVSHDAGVLGMAGYNIDRRLIHSVYISETARGKRIGSKLMRLVLEETRDAENPARDRTILVASANTRAAAFYERLGFQKSGTTKAWAIGETSIPEDEFYISD